MRPQHDGEQGPLTIELSIRIAASRFAQHSGPPSTGSGRSFGGLRAGFAGGPVWLAAADFALGPTVGWPGGSSESLPGEGRVDWKTELLGVEGEVLHQSIVHDNTDYVSAGGVRADGKLTRTRGEGLSLVEGNLVLPAERLHTCPNGHFGLGVDLDDQRVALRELDPVVAFRPGLACGLAHEEHAIEVLVKQRGVGDASNVIAA